MFNKTKFLGSLSIIVSVVLFLIALEVVLRFGLVKNERYKKFYYSNKMINSQKKILILGDSFGVIANRFLLDMLKPYNVSLLNISSSGFGPFEYKQELEATGASFKPNVTVLFYYVGNDLTNVEYNRNRKWRFKNKIYSLFYKTYLYHFYREKKNVFFPNFFDYKELSSKGINSKVITLAKSGEINPWLLREAVNNKNYIADNILMESDDNMTAWEETKSILSKMERFCKKINTEFIIVIFPSTLQVNRSHYSFYESLGFSIDKRMLSCNKPQELLLEFCSENNILCLDLLPFLKALPEQEFYSENDDHLNMQGNELCVKTIKDFLSKKYANF